jgi:hypothetical protein
MGALRCHFALDEKSDALVHYVVAHSSDVSGADVCGEDATQPWPPFRGPLELDGEHLVVGLAGGTDDGAVWEVQPRESRWRELELTTRARERHRELLLFRGPASQCGVRRPHFPFRPDSLTSQLALELDHHRGELDVVRIGADVDAGRRQFQVGD